MGSAMEPVRMAHSMVSTTPYLGGAPSGGWGVSMGCAMGPVRMAHSMVSTTPYLGGAPSGGCRRQDLPLSAGGLRPPDLPKKDPDDRVRSPLT